VTARAALKRLRAWPPLNKFATGSTRALLEFVGARPEFVVRHLHRVGAVESRLPNGRALRLWSRADDWVSNQVYWRAWTGYEPETAPLFYLLASRARVTLDVGAYVGFFTLLAAHANVGGRVYAFEPLAEAFERLRDNVSRNGLRNVVCVPTAVGREPGEANFFHMRADRTVQLASDAEDSIPCSSSLSESFMTASGPVESRRVPVITLDSHLGASDRAQVDLVKIDTETTEADVLEGARLVLEASHPTIVCEVLPGGGTERRLEAQLFPLGYRAFHLTSSGPVLRERVEGHAQWLNYLFSVHEPPEVVALDAEARALAGLRPSG
jgi:FkbM family methyltransferase